MEKLQNKELAELGLTESTRVVTIEKSRDDREGQRMGFALLPDYTYQIEPVPEAESTDRRARCWTCSRKCAAPRSLVGAGLCGPRLAGRCSQETRHQVQLDKLEGQKLIHRCPAPADWRGKGRKPIFYEAGGMTFQEIQRSRAWGVRETPCKKRNPFCWNGSKQQSRL